MPKKDQKLPICAPPGKAMNCCKVESIISVDERGQMVLPKELRDKANIRAGDKLAVVSWDQGGEICCIYLIKTGTPGGTGKGLARSDDDGDGCILTKELSYGRDKKLLFRATNSLCVVHPGP